MGRSRNPARAQAFQQLRARHRFGERALMSVASGFRVGWLRQKVMAQEAQVLGARVYEAVNRWVLGQRGRPRFKGRGRGLHSLAAKDLCGALRIAADGSGLQWGSGLVLRFAVDPRSPFHRWAAAHVANGRLRFCRIVRVRVRGRWVYSAQLVLDGRPLARYQAGDQLVGLDVGPSVVAVVSDHGAWKETFGAELDDKATELRRLQRRLAKHRKAMHGNLANRILGQGKAIHTEKLSYRAFQRSFGRSVGRRSAGHVHHHPLPQGCKRRRSGGVDRHPDHPALPALRLWGGHQEAPQPADPSLRLRGGGGSGRVLGLPRPSRGSEGPPASARRGGRQAGARHAPGLRCRPASSSQQPASPAGRACRVRGNPLRAGRPKARRAPLMPARERWREPGISWPFSRERCQEHAAALERSAA